MIRLFTKIIMSSGLLSGAVLLDAVPVSFGVEKRKKTQKDLKKGIVEIKSMDDIELYEKIHGCSFMFVEEWKSREHYKSRQFLKNIEDLKTKGNGLTLSDRSIFEWANEGKQYCKGKIVTIFRDGDKLRLGNPTEGWDLKS